jgi:gamma-glutamylcysteine synthetase
MADERFDGVFMGTVQQAQGIDNFFDALFAFMRRKTDLFTLEDQARKTVNASMEKHIKLFQEDKVRQEAIARKKKEEGVKRAQAAQAAEVKKMAEAHKDEVASDTIMEVSEEEARQIELEEAAKKAGKTLEKKVENKEEKKDGEEDDSDKGALPNTSNGGNLDKYNWG